MFDPLIPQTTCQFVLGCVERVSFYLILSVHVTIDLSFEIWYLYFQRETVIASFRCVICHERADTMNLELVNPSICFLRGASKKRDANLTLPCNPYFLLNWHGIGKNRETMLNGKKANSSHEDTWRIIPGLVCG